MNPHVNYFDLAKPFQEEFNRRTVELADALEKQSLSPGTPKNLVYLFLTSSANYIESVIMAENNEIIKALKDGSMSENEALARKSCLGKYQSISKFLANGAATLIDDKPESE